MVSAEAEVFFQPIQIMFLVGFSLFNNNNLIILNH